MRYYRHSGGREDWRCVVLTLVRQSVEGWSVGAEAVGVNGVGEA